MARDFERRLARAETAAHALGGVDAQAGRRRCSLRALVAVCDIVRERLVAMRLDPELAVALRRGEEAGAEPAGMPDTRELRASEAAVTGPNSSGARDGLHTKMARIADSMRRGLVAARSRLTSGMPRSSSCLHSFRLSVRSRRPTSPSTRCVVMTGDEKWPSKYFKGLSSTAVQSSVARVGTRTARPSRMIGSRPSVIMRRTVRTDTRQFSATWWTVRSTSSAEGVPPA